MAKDGPKGGMSVQDAGRKGGTKVAAERGRAFYAQIGKKGGKAVSQNRAHMAAIGKKGGERRRVGSAKGR